MPGGWKKTPVVRPAATTARDTVTSNDVVYLSQLNCIFNCKYLFSDLNIINHSTSVFTNDFKTI